MNGKTQDEGIIRKQEMNQTTDTKEKQWRHVLGDNLAYVRNRFEDNYRTLQNINYVVITLCAGYLVRKSRLARRFYSVSDIPRRDFERQARLRGTIFKVEAVDKDIIFYIFHLPFFSRIFPSLYTRSGPSLLLKLRLLGVANVDGFSKEHLIYNKGITSENSVDASFRLFYLDNDMAVCNITRRKPGSFFQESINLDLVRNGSAKYRVEISGQHASHGIYQKRRLNRILDDIKSAESKAKEAKRGIWAKKESLNNESVKSSIPKRIFSGLKRFFSGKYP